MLAPPLILAMQGSGRSDEAAELRRRLSADLAQLEAEGDTYLRLPVSRAQLAALDGRPDVAAHWIDEAVAAGWKGQAPYRLAFGPDEDPVFALVRGDARVKRAITRYRASVGNEGAALRRLRIGQQSRTTRQGGVEHRE